jgi:hypothetical protein
MRGIKETAGKSSENNKEEGAPLVLYDDEGRNSDVVSFAGLPHLTGL